MYICICMYYIYNSCLSIYFFVYYIYIYIYTQMTSRPCTVGFPEGILSVRMFPGRQFILMPDAGASEHMELDAPRIIHLPWSVWSPFPPITWLCHGFFSPQAAGPLGKK